MAKFEDNHFMSPSPETEKEKWKRKRKRDRDRGRNKDRSGRQAKGGGDSDGDGKGHGNERNSTTMYQRYKPDRDLKPGDAKHGATALGRRSVWIESGPH